MEENNENFQHGTPQLENKNAFCIYQDVESFTPKTPVAKQTSISVLQPNHSSKHELCCNVGSSTDRSILQKEENFLLNCSEISDSDELQEELLHFNSRALRNSIEDDKENINPFTKQRVTFRKSNVQSLIPLRDVTHLYETSNAQSPSFIPQQSKSNIKTRNIR